MGSLCHPGTQRIIACLPSSLILCAAPPTTPHALPMHRVPTFCLSALSPAASSRNRRSATVTLARNAALYPLVPALLHDVNLYLASDRRLSSGDALGDDFSSLGVIYRPAIILHTPWRANHLLGRRPTTGHYRWTLLNTIYAACAPRNIACRSSPALSPRHISRLRMPSAATSRVARR